MTDLFVHHGPYHGLRLLSFARQLGWRSARARVSGCVRVRVVGELRTHWDTIPGRDTGTRCGATPGCDTGTRHHFLTLRVDKSFVDLRGTSKPAQLDTGVPEFLKRTRSLRMGGSD